jgi:hypothetical protein
VRELEVPPDHQTKAWRTEANLQAMRLVLAKEPGELTTEDLQIIAQYSGWGGLSIDRVRKLLPPDFVPETFDLIHAYYTPTVITESLAELLCPLLPELAGNDGVVRALEPSAGIGRLIRSFSPRRCLALEAGGQIKRIAWTAVEFSKVSSTLLRALRPDVDLYHMPFERWIREEGALAGARSASSSPTRPTASAARWPARTPTSSTRRSAPTRTSCAARSTCWSPAGSACSSSPPAS